MTNLITLKDFINDLDPHVTVIIGVTKAKAFEWLGRYTWCDKNGCYMLNLNTYNYRAYFNKDLERWEVNIYG